MQRQVIFGPVFPGTGGVAMLSSFPTCLEGNTEQDKSGLKITRFLGSAAVARFPLIEKHELKNKYLLF